MKISVDIDCSPAEAREFLGLPDVGPVQELVLEEMKRHMSAGMAAMDPGKLFQAVFPQNVGSWDALQKAFWAQMSGGASDSKKK